MNAQSRVVLNTPYASVQGVRFDTATDSDCVHLAAGCVSVKECSFYDIADAATKQRPHRDFIQLVPALEGVQRSQFIGAELADIVITDCEMQGDSSQIQGIFCSDGLLSELFVANNQICTNSARKMAINGLLSGHFENNSGFLGQLIEVLLYPLRWGAEREIVTAKGSIGGCTWIVGFRDNCHEYQPIAGNNPVLDYRTRTDFRPRHPYDVFLTEFDFMGAQEAALDYLKRANQQLLKTEIIAADLQDLALQFGVRV